MLISIIIPTFNRNDLLSICLDLLYPQTQVNKNFTLEVIVSDDSINKLALQLIEVHYSWVKWIEGPRKGPAANRNSAAKNARGEWLIFLDDDCLPQKGWLKSYLDAIELHTDNLVFEGCTDVDRPQQRFDEEAPINLKGNKLWSCNFAIKRDFFNQLKGFDETFPYAAMEDVDFYHRVILQTKIVFVSQAFLIHPWRRIFPFKSFKKHLISHKYFVKKYRLSGNPNYVWSRIKIFIGGVINNFVELLGYSMKGWRIYLERCILNFCLIFI